MDDAEPQQGYTPKKYPGYAISALAFTYDRIFTGNVFISSAYPGALFLPAHEVGHILTNDSHAGDRHNLMWKEVSNSKDAKSAKRLNAGQAEIIRRSPYTR